MNGSNTNIAPRALHSFSLKDLATALEGELVNDTHPSLMVNGASYSSRDIKKGEVFIAIPGLKVDGHSFIEAAIENGATALVVSDKTKLDKYPGIVVKNPRVAASRLSRIFFGDPSAELKVIGVTGTNGKTTIHWLCSHVLTALGTPNARLGTLGFSAPGIDLPGELTTPDPLVLHKLLRLAIDHGAKVATMEVSSGGLDQARADDVSFDVGIFTNLTRDHLDYHGTMEAYFVAKQRLFELMASGNKSCKTAVINTDDSYGIKYAELATKLGLKVISYGAGSNTDLTISSFSQKFSGSSFKLRYQQKEYEISSSAIGLHNAYNFAAVCAALIALGYEINPVIECLKKAPLVPGRLEPVGNEKIGVYVDFAHTPDALENVLRSARELTTKKLWVVFGCGGDRDKGKRPLMAEVVSRYADKAIVTSDNPRTEDPQQIINDILQSGVKVHLTEVDRRTAIERTLSEAGVGDVVIIAGKGHEDYQIIGATKIHFSDQEVVREFLLP